ncbi:unnamed protein product, partial [Symbiodinium necroappetens]
HGFGTSRNPEGNQMPLHYSSARYTTSLRCKALSLAAAWEVRGFEDWSAVTDTELERIKGAVQTQVDQVIVGDRTTVFQAPVTTETLHRSLALTRTWRYRAAKTRARSSQEQVERMPATLNGKVLTAFLKNGQALCASFQLGKCQLAEQDWSSHRCAVALRSGRACGGNHPAHVCFEKRALLAQTAKEPGPTGQTVLPQRRAAPAEPSAPPPKRARLPLADEVPGEAASSSSTTAKATPKAASKAAPKVALKAAPKVKALGPRLPVTARFRGVTLWFSGRRARRPLVVPEEAARRIAEAPTVIWQSGSGGRLFLSGLPTAATAQYFPKVSLQVTCFDKSPEQRGGVLLPGALGIKLDFKSKDREEAFQHAFDLTKNSLWSGEHVLFHCMAGRHRAATYAGLTRSLLAFESLPDALRGVGDFVHR